MTTLDAEYDDEAADLMRQRKHQRRMSNQFARHPDPRDPDHPDQDDDGEDERTCLGCGKRHPFNVDGTPVGGALPCGH